MVIPVEVERFFEQTAEKITDELLVNSPYKVCDEVKNVIKDNTVMKIKQYIFGKDGLRKDAELSFFNAMNTANIVVNKAAKENTK
ncbi:MAG: hypothetical protein MJ052_01125 [Sphaerochaetaceae bacterium]|nr:hypothetical protein [Sphaerochaetaceae bacterium]